MQYPHKTFNIEDVPRKINSRSTWILPWLMICCGMILLSIWPLIHTMALRNILIFSGGLTGLWYLLRERSNLYQKSALPLLFITLFFIWVGTHYLLFARNPVLELANIKGTWARALLACFLGVGSGLFARHHQRVQQAVWISIFSFVIIFYINYILISLTRNSWAIPYPNELGIYGNKISVAFYGIMLLALICGVISYQLLKNTKNNGPIFFLSVVGIGLVFFAFIIVGTKNGVALGLVLILSLLVLFISRAKKSLKNISLLAGCLVFIGLATYLHLKLNPEWNNFFPTVAIGVQVDTYPNWQDDITYGLPKLADGTPVPVSAYLRTAYATEGLKLMLENPLGYGLTDQSFRYLVLPIVSLDKAPRFALYGTHSGWLDFTLGLGIPGLLLTWSAIASAIFYSYKQWTSWSCYTRWILAGVFISWISAEIDSSHFIETLFYLIALLSAGNLPVITREGR